MIRVAICEDNFSLNLHFEGLLTEFAQNIKEELAYDCFLSGEKLLAELNKPNVEAYHIYLLDVELPSLNGIEVAEKIRKKQEEAIIIFLTGYEKYAVKAFRVAAFDYLVKPIDKELLFTTLSKALQRLIKKKDYFIYQKKKTTCAVPYEDILYFESNQRKISVVTHTDIHTFYGKLSDIEQKVTNSFARMHQSYLVNLASIRKITVNTALLANGEQLPISKPYKNSFSSQYIKALTEGCSL